MFGVNKRFALDMSIAGQEVKSMCRILGDAFTSTLRIQCRLPQLPGLLNVLRRPKVLGLSHSLQENLPPAIRFATICDSYLVT